MSQWGSDEKTRTLVLSFTTYEQGAYFEGYMVSATSV